MRRLALLASSLTLAACSTVGGGVGDTLRMTTNGMGDAIAAPFRDFNIIRPTIPVALAEAAKGPYRRPERTDCAFLAHEIAELDLALGPDLDVPRGAEKTSLRTRGAVAISDAAISAVKDAATGWIPFRSVVRRITGADGRQDDVEDAVHAGGIRRAYLKGLGLLQKCPHPAAPLTPMTIAADTPDEPPSQPASAHTPAIQRVGADPADDAKAAVQPVALAGAPGA